MPPEYEPLPAVALPREGAPPGGPWRGGTVLAGSGPLPFPRSSAAARYALYVSHMHAVRGAWQAVRRAHGGWGGAAGRSGLPGRPERTPCGSGRRLEGPGAIRAVGGRPRLLNGGRPGADGRPAKPPNGTWKRPGDARTVDN
ncbi:hypothetical protein TPA0909_34100 [Streptomyces albus]|nr:hypothetical protein TPA0909_34100 [Streptomyces albus]